MTRTKNDLALKLGIPTEVVEYRPGSKLPIQLLPEEAPPDDPSALSEEDFKMARANILDAISKGKRLLDAVTEVALQSDTARVFAVATDLMKQYVEINEKLLDLHQRRLVVDPAPATEPQQTETVQAVTQNLTIVGTTTEVLRSILEAKRGKVIDGDDHE